MATKVMESIVRASVKSPIRNYMITVRVDKETRDKFMDACQRNGSSANKTLASFIKEYIKEYGD